MTDYCEHSHEPSGFKEGGKLLGELSDCQLLVKDSSIQPLTVSV
jgi:hypothetical protein